MPFFALLGHEIPTATDPVVTHPEDHIDRQRTYARRLVEGTRGKPKRVWEASTPILAPDDARAYTALLQGKGSRAAFDTDALTSRGLAPKSGSTYTLNSGAPGNGYVVPTSLRYAAGLASRWTLLATVLISGNQRRIARRDDGTCYLAGAEAFGSDKTLIQNILSVATGDVLLQGALNTYDLEWWHERLTVDMLGDMTTQEYASELPFLAASGDIFDGASVNVRGIVQEEPFFPVEVNGSWTINARRVEFSLLEV